MTIDKNHISYKIPTKSTHFCESSKTSAVFCVPGIACMPFPEHHRVLASMICPTDSQENLCSDLALCFGQKCGQIMTVSTFHISHTTVLHHLPAMTCSKFKFNKLYLYNHHNPKLQTIKAYDGSDAHTCQLSYM